jgi:tetratricopeptide (TPR) repeat protein
MNTCTNDPHDSVLEGPPIPPTHEVTTAAHELERARAYLDTGLVLEAGEIFEGLLDTDMPEARLGLARCAYARRELHLALSHLQALQQQRPDHPGLCNDLGVIYHALGLTAAAHEQLRQAAQTTDDPITLRNLIAVAQELDDSDACIEYCERLLQIDPEDEEVRDLLVALRNA